MYSVRVNPTINKSSSVMFEMVQAQKTRGRSSLNDARSRHSIKFRQLYLHFTQKSLPALLLPVTQEEQGLLYCSGIPPNTSKVCFCFTSKNGFFWNKRHFTLWRLRLGKTLSAYMTVVLYVCIEIVCVCSRVSQRVKRRHCSFGLIKLLHGEVFVLSDLLLSLFLKRNMLTHKKQTNKKNCCIHFLLECRKEKIY